MSDLKVGDIVYQISSRIKFTGPCEVLQVDLEPKTGPQVLIKGASIHKDMGILQNWLPAECVRLDIGGAEYLKSAKELYALPSEPTEQYDMVNPSHYKDKQIETIEKMRRIWGNEAVALYCDMNEFRYRERIGDKPENPIEQESKKFSGTKQKPRS